MKAILISFCNVSYLLGAKHDERENEERITALYVYSRCEKCEKFTLLMKICRCQKKKQQVQHRQLCLYCCIRSRNSLLFAFSHQYGNKTKTSTSFQTSEGKMHESAKSSQHGSESSQLNRNLLALANRSALIICISSHFNIPLKESELGTYQPPRPSR